jgi:hypothetical protein
VESGSLLTLPSSGVGLGAHQALAELDLDAAVAGLLVQRPVRRARLLVWAAVPSTNRPPLDTEPVLGHCTDGHRHEGL